MLRDPSRSFKERVFILLTLVTDLGVILALIGDIIIGENIVEIVILAVTVTVVPVITIVSVTKNRVYVAVRMIVIGLVLFIIPTLFYFGGGVHGGAIVWIIFTYLYTGLVLSGKWKPIMLAVLTCETIILYTDKYLQPGEISAEDVEKYNIDTMISVILIGIVCCMMVWFVEWLFREENKRAREETKKFEELNKSQNRFFSSMSHEIRTPINSILGLNEIILRQEDASEEIKRDAGNIQGAGKMLLSLVNDILDVSRIEAGKMDIIPVNYKVADLLSEIVNMIWLRAEEKGIELSIQIDPSIPTELFGDEIRIKQILVNLLNNAVKYTKEGSVTLYIEKEDIKEDSVQLVFSVSDTGMGIREEALPYLFDAFQRTDEEVNRKIEGTGLGLSIVKQLVGLMGGEIDVNSVYTQGSTFTVKLWQKVSNPKAVGDISITGDGNIRDDRKYEASFTAPDARVLIVDDNELNLEVEKKLLEGTGIRIDLESSAEAALTLTLTNRYDVILMDHLMPQMDGIECMRMIRKQAGGLNNHAPIIALTANAGSENRELYRTSGFDGYLLKPVSGQQLEELLLLHLPESKVVRDKKESAEKSQLSTGGGYNKKVPVLITTSSLCDLPMNTLKELQIDILPFRIHVDGREYYDGIEADTDEILRYSREGKEFESEPPTVEEFEHFFAAELKKAHQVIYITIASGISREYESAREASKNFGNVYVFNSGVNSSSTGLLVLIAYNMAILGMTPGNIIGELGRLRSKVHCSFIANDPTVLLKRGLVSRGMYSIINSIGVRLLFEIRRDTFALYRVMIGDRIKCYFRYVDYALKRRYRPDTDVVFVTYSGISDDTLKAIGERIKKRVPFKNIIFQKASGVLALSCGTGSFGILYLEEGDHPYNLEKMLVPYRDTRSEERSDAGRYHKDAEYDNIFKMPVSEEEDEKAGGKWYAALPGINPAAGIANSGSEESFKSVLEIFYNTLEDRTQEIRSYFDNKDFENYTIKVHALKSSARLIGAQELSADCEALEMAGKEKDTDFIDAHHGALLRELEELKKPLSDIFEKNEEIPKESAGFCGEDMDDLMMRSMYEALENGIEQKNEALLSGTFKEMQDYQLPECCKGIAEKLKELYEIRDYEGMSRVLKERK